LGLLKRGWEGAQENARFREHFRGRVVSCVGQLVPKGTFEKSVNVFKESLERFLELWVFVIARR